LTRSPGRFAINPKEQYPIMNPTSSEQTGASKTKTFPSSERREAVKNEYFNGRVSPKPAANRWHNLIASNFPIAVASRIHGNKCEIYTGGMRVRIGNDSLCYPDVVVVSGEPKFTNENFDVLQNPTVVVEVFSNLTNSSVRTQKLEGYLAISSVKECLLVNEDEMRIEHYTRQNAKQWIYRIYNEREDVISLDGVNCKLSLSEVYAQVKLRPSELTSGAVN